jgi:hypothetical protein
LVIHDAPHVPKGHAQHECRPLWKAGALWCLPPGVVVDNPRDHGPPLGQSLSMACQQDKRAGVIC